ncbi:nucleotide-diphospho-sugar transferase [Apodospora peruviana]|uniref:Translation initiation factor eIF2B subunit gamma n=1 Tax=Apodospora peruviana TaxID=516989 RepID=A0AAE0HXK9_9PEZI|nr:nucleotide-diphospho-sugar transferase [Apodospora peruviana]
MPHAVTIATPGLQALILCGPGSSFPTFTANPDENPKVLLPIANRPMVWYPLDFCYRAGITDITLVCPPSAADAITTALNTNPFLTSLPYPRPDLLSPKDLDQNTGTAEILRLPELQEVVKSDFLVLPCDLVCELGADKLLQAWMVKSASLPDLLGDTRSPNHQRSGGLGVWYQTKTETPIKEQETDFMATVPLPPSSMLPPKGSLFPHISGLVYSMPTDSLKDLLEEKKEGFPVRHGLLRAHPRIRMLTTYRDAHIYIFPRWVMDFVKENERLETIGEDVIGWWAKAGWQKGLAEKLGLDKILAEGGGGGNQDNAEGEKSAGASAVASPRIDSASPNLDGSSSPPNNLSSSQTLKSVSVKDMKDQAHHDESSLPTTTAAVSCVIPPMLAYIHPSSSSELKVPLIRRVDTAQLLLQTSLQLAKLPSIEEAGELASPFAHPRKVAYPEGVKARTTITKADSLVAENVTVQEKTSIKECVIGANCQINEGAKLSQCLLMDGVVVGKNCKLTKCILGKRSEIGEGCTLTECEVQENLLVEPKTEAKQEKLMSSAGLEAAEEDADQGDGDDDGDEEAAED